MPNKKKILVAEDEQSYASIYKLKLEKEGYRVFIAGDGEKAIEIAKKEKPDIALLDLIMPKVDGFEVIKTLKSDPELKSIPIIVFSNLGQTSDMEKVKDLGAEKYFVKANISIQKVIEEVRSFIG